jgi:CRP-like cAMP-binding protein
MSERRDAVSNKLLASIPHTARKILLPKMDRVSLSVGDILYEAGQQLNFAYFPEDALLSVGIVVDGHAPLEIAMIGSEGMAGAGLGLGIESATFTKTVSVSGVALRIESNRFKEVLEKFPALRKDLSSYSQSLFRQTAQSAACHRYHVVEQRLARWLLAGRDRSGKVQFQVTQEFLSQLLGVRRVGVTNAASMLQKRKLIRYSRGNLAIINGPGLEEMACSCYINTQS